MSNEELQEQVNQLREKTDHLEKRIDEIQSGQSILNGETLLDNQDLCFQFKVSKRSLQRYRSQGKLKYQLLDQKTYYYKSDVEEFIKKHLVEINKYTENNPPKK